MPSVEEIKSDIRLLIRLAHQPSFVEMTAITALNGDGLFSLDDTNVIFWHRISPEGAQALRELLTDREIAMREAHPMVYGMTDLDLPPYPLALDFERHEGVHWMPVLFCKKNMRGYERTFN